MQSRDKLPGFSACFFLIPSPPLMTFVNTKPLSMEFLSLKRCIEIGIVSNISISRVMLLPLITEWRRLRKNSELRNHKSDNLIKGSAVEAGLTKSSSRCWFFNNSEKYFNASTFKKSQTSDEESGPLTPTLLSTTFLTIVSSSILVMRRFIYLFPIFILLYR